MFLVAGTVLSLVIFPLSIWNVLEPGDADRLKLELRTVFGRG